MEHANQWVCSMSTRQSSRAKRLDAALDIFRARGYTATTVDDVCGAAGLGKGSFFRHVTGKEELADPARVDRGPGGEVEAVELAHAREAGDHQRHLDAPLVLARHRARAGGPGPP
jgi:hypothetical protein